MRMQRPKGAAQDPPPSASGMGSKQLFFDRTDRTPEEAFKIARRLMRSALCERRGILSYFK
jgi:hypothetical protein